MLERKRNLRDPTTSVTCGPRLDLSLSSFEQLRNQLGEQLWKLEYGLGHK